MTCEIAVANKTEKALCVMLLEKLFSLNICTQTFKIPGG